MTSTNTSSERFPWDYFALAFAFSWLIWLPGVLITFNVISVSIPVEAIGGPLTLAGLFGPMFAACVLLFRSEGWAGVKRHLGRLTDFHIRLRWWAVIVLLPISIQAAAHYLPLVAGQSLLKSLIPSVGVFFFTLALVTLIGGGQEELGWRSYALDRIQKRHSALISSLILGVFWACWHIPLWFLPGTNQGDTPFIPFVVAILGLSVILTWVYRNTGNSMVAVIITHGITNASHPLFPVISRPGAGHNEYVYWALATVMVAVVVTLLWGSGTLTGKQAGQRFGQVR